MTELQLLIITAASLGFVHTILGPDHYLPFIVLSKARNWSQSKTMWITLVSGIGHVGSSIIIGVIGIILGISVNKLKIIEANRGEVVGWLIVVFGLSYTIFGIYKFIKNGGHRHLPSFLVPKEIRDFQHLDETNVSENTKLTPWILFLIFVFGPCEVLIPMLIFPAAKFNTIGIISVSTVFGIATILTMLTIVFLGYKGSSLIKIKNSGKYMHLIAGIIILIAGLGMTVFGW